MPLKESKLMTVETGTQAKARTKASPKTRASTQSRSTAKSAPQSQGNIHVVTLVEALNRALCRAMTDDPDVVVLGEDGGINGGVFCATLGLREDFGYKRVVIPLSPTRAYGLLLSAIRDPRS